jgi:uncharacterized DUF497 family protein
VQFEWDEAKRRANIKKHGFDFKDAAKVFDGFVVTVEDTRQEYGEPRFISLGLLEGRIVYIAHTERGNRIRIISMRKANGYEAKSYLDQI